jgi:O-antigen ligase
MRQNRGLGRGLWRTGLVALVLWVALAGGALNRLPGASAADYPVVDAEHVTVLRWFQDEDAAPVVVEGPENPVTEDPIDINAQIGMWLVILGFLSQFAISFINGRMGTEDPLTKGGVALVFCLLVALVDTFIRQTLNLTNLTASLLLVFSSAIGFYTTWFKPSGMAAKVEGKRV